MLSVCSRSTEQERACQQYQMGTVNRSHMIVYISVWMYCVCVRERVCASCLHVDVLYPRATISQ